MPSKTLGCLSLTALPSQNWMLYNDILRLSGPLKSCRVQSGWVLPALENQAGFPEEFAHTPAASQRAVLDDKWDYWWQRSRAGASSVCSAIPRQTCACLCKVEASTSLPPYPSTSGDHSIMFNTGECRVT